MPKDQAFKKKKKLEVRHNPLYGDIRETARPKNRQKTEKQLQEEDYLPKALSQKLLKQVQEQQAEVDRESLPSHEKTAKTPVLETPDESDREEEHDIYETEAVEIDPSDESALEMFMGGGKTILNLGALIMEKIKEKEMQANNTSADDILKATLDPKVITVYSQIGTILKTYRSGKLPKAIKILPLLTNWEEILYVTRPESWSPAAVRQITKIFASNFNEKMAQKYYNLVLLPQLREDIQVHKKLNWHIYMALKKSLYKPAAFYKGILIPLCEARDCSLREAIIVSSVIRKVSVPALESCVALLKIASMPYSGTNSLFIRVLIDKKYALPLRVIDGLVDHYLQFKNETRTLPVIWHQSLLSFAQRYKQDITAEQKQGLKLLIREKNHPKITEEIRRELFSTKSRGQENLLKEKMDLESIADMDS